MNQFKYIQLKNISGKYIPNGIILLLQNKNEEKRAKKYMQNNWRYT